MIVQTLWIGSTLSPLERLALASHVDHGHDVHLYSYGRIDNVPRGVLLRDGSEVLPADQVFAYQSGPGKGSFSAFSNYFRYWLLLQKGGWWFDTDVICLRPWDLPGDYVIATEQHSVTHLPHAATCVMKVPKASPLMQACWDAADAKDRTKIVWSEVGPKLLQEKVKELRLAHFMVDTTYFCPIHHFEAQKFVEPLQPSIKGSYGVHAWNEMWNRIGLDKNAIYHGDSLFETLKRMHLDNVREPGTRAIL